MMSNSEELMQEERVMALSFSLWVATNQHVEESLQILTNEIEILNNHVNMSKS